MTSFFRYGASGFLAHGIVGGGIGMGPGRRVCSRVRAASDQVAWFLQRGRSNQGVLYECFNIASLWKLPIIYVVREQPLCAQPCRRARDRGLAPRADAFRLAWAIADGKRAATFTAMTPRRLPAPRRKGARSSECKTYRCERIVASSTGGRRGGRLLESEGRDPSGVLSRGGEGKVLTRRRSYKSRRGERELADAIASRAKSRSRRRRQWRNRVGGLKGQFLRRLTYANADL